MSERKKPDEANKPGQSNSSRTVAIAAVGVLIVVAIAGIVLAGRQGTPPTAPAVAVRVPSAGVVNTTPQMGESPTVPNPNEIIFAAASARLPATASEVIAKYAESTRRSPLAVRMSAHFATGENKAKDIELAKGRTAAVREALLSNGIGPERMQVELVEMPVGSLTEANANRVELSLH